jgi:all-trans-8'-apo-beta-carotenal 15,15'-oxygenase
MTVARTTETDPAEATPNAPKIPSSSDRPRPRLSKSGHDNEAWKKGFTSCPEELPPTVLEFPDLPSDFPVGTYYRNGHGRFESDDGVRVQHMFDGDGLVSAVTFDPERKKILFRNRFVRTEGFLKDKETGTMSKPGVFGTKVSGGFFQNLFRTDFKNVANTHVLYSNDGVLYALWEAGWPHKLDPFTLENDVVKEPKGTDLDGLLKEGDVFAAHYRYDPETQHYVSFGAKLNPAQGNTKISLYEMDATMKTTRSDEMSIVFDGTGLTHDYALTQNWMIFSLPPASINNQAALKALFGMGAFAGVVDFDNDADEALIVMVPRAKHLNEGTAAGMKVGQDNRIRVVKVPYHFSFHCSNAYETDEDSGDVVVDMVLMEEAVTGADMPQDRPVWETVDWDKDTSVTKYVRFRVNPESQQMTAPPQEISVRAVEFPSVPKELSTRKHRYAYAVGSHQEFEPDPVTGKGSGIAGAILKIDTEEPEKTESFSFLPHEFVGEPTFVPKKGADVTKPGQEDKGYLLVYVLNGVDLTTDLVILDIEGKGSLESGPVARMPLPTYIPYALHGTFVEGLTFDF